MANAINFSKLFKNKEISEVVNFFDNQIEQFSESVQHEAHSSDAAKAAKVMNAGLMGLAEWQNAQLATFKDFNEGLPNNIQKAAEEKLDIVPTPSTSTPISLTSTPSAQSKGI